MFLYISAFFRLIDWLVGQNRKAKLKTVELEKCSIHLYKYMLKIINKCNHILNQVNRICLIIKMVKLST